MYNQEVVEPVPVLISRFAYRFIAAVVSFAGLFWVFYYLPGKYFFDQHDMIISSLRLSQWNWFSTTEAKWVDTCFLTILFLFIACGVIITIINLLSAIKRPSKIKTT